LIVAGVYPDPATGQPTPSLPVRDRRPLRCDAQPQYEIADLVSRFPVRADIDRDQEPPPAQQRSNARIFRRRRRRVARRLKHPGIRGDSNFWKQGWSHHGSQDKPTTRWYTVEQKEQAVRLVRKIRAETHTAMQRVAAQRGYGIESVRSWVKQADIDGGVKVGVTTAEAERLKRLEQENRELRRANEILRRALIFFAAELDRPKK
jgi:transposase